MCMSFIEQELDSLGLPTCIETSTPGVAGLNIVPALNAIYELLQIHRRDMGTVEELERDQHKKSSTLEQVHMNNSRLKVSLSIMSLCILLYSTGLKLLTTKSSYSFQSTMSHFYQNGPTWDVFTPKSN